MPRSLSTPENHPGRVRRLSRSITPLTFILLIILLMAPVSGGDGDVPEWGSGFSWYFYTDNQEGSQQTSPYGDVIIDRITIETTMTVNNPATSTFNGEDVYVVSSTSSSISSGSWNLMGFSGSFADVSSSTGTEYYRISDLAMVGGIYESAGVLQLGGLPGLEEGQAYTSTTRVVYDPPEVYLDFPLSLGKQWEVDSNVNVELDLAYEGISPQSETIQEKEEYTSTVIGSEDVEVGGVLYPDCWVIDRGEKGVRYYSPDAMVVVKDTKENRELLSFSTIRPALSLSLQGGPMVIVRSGDTSTIPLTVTNNGETPITELNLSITVGDVQDGWLEVGMVEGDSTVTVDLPFSLPPGTDSSTPLVVSVVSYVQDSVTNTSDALARTLIMPEYTGPDASIFYAATDDEPRLGIPGRIGVRVMNVGAEDLTSDVDVHVIVDGNLVGGTTLEGPFNVGDSPIYTSVQWTPRTPGDHEVMVMLGVAEGQDEDGSFPSATGNNLVSFMVDVPLADHAMVVDVPGRVLAERGDTFDIPVTLRNVGLLPDTFDIMVTSLPEGMVLGSPVNDSLELGSGKNITWTLNLTTPEDALRGEHRINLSVVSRGDPHRSQNVSIPLILFNMSSLVVTAPDIVSFSPGEPGEPMELEFVVENKGESEELLDLYVFMDSDVFHIELYADEPFVDIPSISPGEILSFTLVVHAPLVDDLPNPGTEIPVILTASTGRKYFQTITNVTIEEVAFLDMEKLETAHIEGEVNIQFDLGLSGNTDLDVRYEGVLMGVGLPDTPMEVIGPDSLEPGSDSVISVSLPSTAQLVPGDYTVRLRVFDMAGRLLKMEDVPVSTDERISLSIDVERVEPADLSHSFTSNDTVVYEVTVINDGNVIFCGDLEVYSEEGASRSLVTPAMPGLCIQSGSSDTERVRMSLPLERPGIPYSLVFEMVDGDTVHATTKDILPVSIDVPSAATNDATPFPGAMELLLVLVGVVMVVRRRE